MVHTHENDPMEQSIRTQGPTSIPPSQPGVETAAYQFSSESPLSARLERPYFSRVSYDTLDEAKANLAAAKKNLPKIESAYEASGKMPFKAGCGLLAVTPFILLLMLGCSLAVVLGEAYAEETLISGFLNLIGVPLEYSDRVYDSDAGWLFAIASIIVDIIVAGIILVVPGWLYNAVSKRLKNRNTFWPAMLTLVVAFITAIVFFWPIWDGLSLAPVEIIFLFIPLKWIFIIVGGGIIPLLAPLFTAANIGEQKFCEISEVYLKMMESKRFSFDWAEDALALLTAQDYAQLKQIPGSDIGNPSANLTLWGHEKAETAYLELTASFLGKATVRNKEGKMEEKSVSESWLIFSKKLDRAEAEQFVAQMS